MTPSDVGADDAGASNASWAAAVLNALPVGVAVYDAAQRAVLVNPTYCAAVGLPPGGIPPGTKLQDTVQQAAYCDLFDAGDFEAQGVAALPSDRSRPGPLRRRYHDGRSYDLMSQKLPGGGHVVCAIETTPLIAALDGPKCAPARMTPALTTLPIGLADARRRATLLDAILELDTARRLRLRRRSTGQHVQPRLHRGDGGRAAAARRAPRGGHFAGERTPANTAPASVTRSPASKRHSTSADRRCGGGSDRTG